MKNMLPTLHSSLRECDREISFVQKQLQSLTREKATLQKQIKEFPSPQSPQKFSSKVGTGKSSVERYALFNEMLKVYGYVGGGGHFSKRVYRDRTKTGKLSIKVDNMKLVHRKIARKLCDKVSTGVSYVSYCGIGHKQQFERYIFHNIPGRSKFAPSHV